MPTDPAGTRTRGVARRGTAIRRIDDPQVRKARHEAEHEHAIRRRGVQATTSSSVIPANRATLREIRPELAAVAHRNRGSVRGPSSLSGRAFAAARSSTLVQRVDVGPQRIEVDRDRSVRRHDVADAGDPRRSIASASATARALTSGSIRSSNSTTSAESPAGDDRGTCSPAVTRAPAAASGECRRTRRST